MPKPAPIIRLVGFSISGMPGEASICDSSFDIQERTGAALWAKIPQDNYSLFSFLNGAAFYSLDEIVFSVKRTSFPCKSESLFTGNFCDGTPGRKVAFQDSVNA